MVALTGQIQRFDWLKLFFFGKPFWRNIRNQFEDLNESENEITKLIRNVNHAIDDVENIRTLELPSVTSKGQNILEQLEKLHPLKYDFLEYKAS